jgi:hypothetical protein
MRRVRRTRRGGVRGSRQSRRPYLDLAVVQFGISVRVRAVASALRFCVESMNVPTGAITYGLGFLAVASLGAAFLPSD